VAVLLVALLGAAAGRQSEATVAIPSDPVLASDAPAPASDLAEGGVLYRAQCAACHHAAGIGGALVFSDNAPSLLGFHPIRVAAAIRSGPGEMPIFGPDALDDGQLQQIVTYVQYLQLAVDPGGAPIGRWGPFAEGLVVWIVGVLAILVAIRWIGRRRA
jgi:ubiquinol-cytochrome c reductase cytochrome c subunit